MSAHKLDVLNDLPQNDNKLKAPNQIFVEFLQNYSKFFVEKWITIM